MNKIISEEINIENVQLSKKSIKIQTVCQFKKKPETFVIYSVN